MFHFLLKKLKPEIPFSRPTLFHFWTDILVTMTGICENIGIKTRKN